MSISNFNDKTVIVINHTHLFEKCSGDTLVLDAGIKQSSSKFVYNKSIWSNVIEAVLQYCRVVFDLFSMEKRVCFENNFFLFFRFLS